MIICGHTPNELKKFPAEKFDCIITSPPYWGLRDYGLEPLIWDAKDGCSHNWQSKQTVWHGDRGKGNHKEVYCDLSEQKSDSAFCSLCGAWRGSLGLEPTFNDQEIEIETMELREDLLDKEKEYVIEELRKCGAI